MAKNGDLYFSDSTSDYGINRVALTGFPNPSGRLIHFSRSTGKTRVLLDRIWFTNGVALSPAEDFVLVNETFSTRIMKVWLRGAKKGTSEVFVEGLPGTPDNLSADADGLWVPLATAVDDANPNLAHILAPYPTARKFIVRLLELIKMPFAFVHSFYPTPFTSAFLREYFSMDMILFILPSRRTILRIDWDGKIVKSLHGSDASAGLITHAMKLDGFIYMGSVTSNFFSRVRYDG